MAKRKTLFHPDYVREKIRTTQLINRLQKFAFGEIELTMTQVRAIEILLRKSIPDLAAVEIKAEQTHRYVVEVPPVLDRDEWQRKYGQNPRPPRLLWTPGSNRRRAHRGTDCIGSSRGEEAAKAGRDPAIC